MRKKLSSGSLHAASSKSSRSIWWCSLSMRFRCPSPPRAMSASLNASGASAMFSARVRHSWRRWRVRPRRAVRRWRFAWWRGSGWAGAGCRGGHDCSTSCIINRLRPGRGEGWGRLHQVRSRCQAMQGQGPLAMGSASSCRCVCEWMGSRHHHHVFCERTESFSKLRASMGKPRRMDCDTDDAGPGSTPSIQRMQGRMLP